MLTLAVILLVVGSLLLALEILLIPGFGLFGATGLVAFVAGLGIIMSVPGVPGTVAFVVAIALLVLGFVAVFLILRFKRPKAIVLEECLSGSAAEDLNYLLGVTGVALTNLRPVGMAELLDKRWAVVTEGEFIPKGTAVVVIQVEGQRIVVKRAG
ncbi:MAG: hypothetical protein GX489_02315 [Firmicutes bacterium]|nr:hypothetical protein [Bacillota bacterium]